MFPLFKKFLVVKISERIQQLSQAKCSGCIGKFLLDQLHPCKENTLEEKINLFLPTVQEEALERLEALFDMYQQTRIDLYNPLNKNYIVDGGDFIKQISLQHLLDRMYINEDTVTEYPFNLSWLMDSPIQVRHEQHEVEEQEVPDDVSVCEYCSKRLLKGSMIKHLTRCKKAPFVKY